LTFDVSNRVSVSEKPAFFIRDLPIHGDLILAPLSGYNDQPFRRLCREFGAALTYTGLLAVNAIFGGSRRTSEMLRFHPAERPLAAQIFGSDEETIEAAARFIEPLGIDVLDVNLGCAEPKVVKGGGGAALLQDPAKIGRIFARLARALSIPVTAKIRLGWDEAGRNYLEVARVLEDNGAALIAVHGRTAVQAYSGAADWDAIAEVKQAVHVPVLASGDVRSVADIDRIRRHTGCNGVMIGRAAVGNPWLFRRLDLAQVPLEERVPVISRHLRWMVDFHGPLHGVQRFRKHLLGYLRETCVARRVRRQLLQCDDPDRLLMMLGQLP
jgi:nifR3 family TIM-barrel protein